MPFAAVNGRRLHYQDTGGDGPAVVFSHGNLMDGEMWHHQVAALRDRFRCVVWDERLHGRTEDDGSYHSYWDSAGDLLGLLDHLGIAEAGLVGHSQGGFLSLRAALREPGRITSLVLMDTAAGAWPPEALAQMGGIRDGFRTAGPEAVAPVLLDLLLGEPGIHPHWLAKWQAQPAARLADAVAVLMGADDLTDRLAGIAAPALIVHGADDRPVPVECGVLLYERLPGAVTLHTVPGAAHTPPLTHPGEVNGVLGEFLLDQASR